jgi:hypothetical protein
MATPDPNSPLGLDVAYHADDRLSVVSGPLLVAQDVLARWETPPGGHPDDPDVGSVYLLQYVNRPFSGSDDPKLWEIEQGCVAEALKDDRVGDITVDVELQATNTPGVKHIQITGNGTTADGPFRLVARISDVTVELLTIEAP